MKTPRNKFHLPRIVFIGEDGKVIHDLEKITPDTKFKPVCIDKDLL